jgi:hypothetical protein
MDRQPDNSYIQQDDGFFFTAWGIHVAAKTVEEAKAHIRDYHGKDVDHDIPPSQPGKPVETVEATAIAENEGAANLSEEPTNEDVRPEVL